MDISKPCQHTATKKQNHTVTPVIVVVVGSTYITTVHVYIQAKPNPSQANKYTNTHKATQKVDTTYLTNISKQTWTLIATNFANNCPTWTCRRAPSVALDPTSANTIIERCHPRPERWTVWEQWPSRLIPVPFEDWASRPIRCLSATSVHSTHIHTHTSRNGTRQYSTIWMKTHVTAYSQRRALFHSIYRFTSYDMLLQRRWVRICHSWSPFISSWSPWKERNLLMNNHREIDTLVTITIYRDEWLLSRFVHRIALRQSASQGPLAFDTKGLNKVVWRYTFLTEVHHSLEKPAKEPRGERSKTNKFFFFNP